MTPLAEIALVTQREIRKNLRSIKGIILLALSLVGGTFVSYLITRWMQSQFEKAPPELVHKAKEEALTQMFHDEATGRYLADAPINLISLLNLCIWLAPALIWLSGFDAVSGEVQHRTIRYWWVRTRRSSFYLGKFLGLWATIAVMTFVMHFAMWVVAIVGGVPAGDILSWGIRFWLLSIPIVGAWCGIAVCVGSLFRTPIMSLLSIGGAFFTIFVVGSIIPVVLMAMRKDMNDPTARVLNSFYPNSYDRMLLSAHADQVLLGILACLAFAAIPTAIGVTVLTKKDV